jgi:Fe-S cluster assembly protein SufD
MGTISADISPIVSLLAQRTSSHEGPLKAVRRAAAERLPTLSFDPEEWGYTDRTPFLEALGDAVKESQGESPNGMEKIDRAAIPARLTSRGIPQLPYSVIVSGSDVVVSESLQQAPIEVCSLSEGSGEDGTGGTRHFGSLSDKSKNPLVALSTAFFQSGIGIHARRQTTLAETIQIVHDNGGSRLHTPRTLITLEEGASISVLEVVVSDGEKGWSGPAVTEIVLAPGAHCSYTHLLEGDSTLQSASSIFVRADRDSVFRSFFLSTTPKTVRTEIVPTLAGPGATVRVAGLSLGTNDQHVDTVVVMEHAAPHCESRQLFKSIHSGRSSGSFSGTIIVQEGAQKTNAFQSSKGILLGRDAVINTRPQLKIWADDVKCSHGATVGQIDEAALFYLRSRGIPTAAARTLLLHAFVGEALAEVDRPDVREMLTPLVDKRLSSVLA